LRSIARNWDDLHRSAEVSPKDGEYFLACRAETGPHPAQANPIENVFAQLKAHVRKSARTLDALERAAANALQQFKPDKRANFFGHAGHGLA
jgi:hypothetical protein